MSALEPIIKLKKVNKVFENGTEALKGMDIDVFKGQFISFLGPSGCGKSTVLRMISGLLKPTSGQIEIYKKTLNSSSKSGEIGFVFQDSTLMPWATVEDNVYLPLRLKGTSKEKVREDI